VDTATPPTTRWCSQCKRENPISEYTSTDARRHGLMKSCRCCRKAQARSKRRQKGDNEYEYDTEHDGRPKELENDTERTDIVQGCSPQEHDNGQMTLCSDCNQETSVGGALEKSSRRVTKLLAFRRALCAKCLQRHDIRIGQGLCGFQDCEWKKSKKTFIEHWEKVHAPKNLECSFPNCLSTISGTTFNKFGLEQHARGTHGARDYYCQEAICTGKAAFTKDRLAQHIYSSHTGPVLRCDIDECHFEVRASRPDLLNHQAMCHGKAVSRSLDN
jgi:hypothetical protein